MARSKLFLSFSLATVIALSGCSSSSDDGPLPTNDSTSTSTTEAATTQTANSGDPICKTSDLEAKIQSTSGAGSSQTFVIALTNRSKGFCAIQGFPAVQLKNKDADVSAVAAEAKEDAIGISVRQTEDVFFDIVFGNVQDGSATTSDCRALDRFDITIPRETSTLQLPITNVKDVCAPGVVTVSPIRPFAAH